MSQTRHKNLQVNNNPFGKLNCAQLSRGCRLKWEWSKQSPGCFYFVQRMFLQQSQYLALCRSNSKQRDLIGYLFLILRKIRNKTRCLPDSRDPPSYQRLALNAILYSLYDLHWDSASQTVTEESTKFLGNILIACNYIPSTKKKLSKNKDILYLSLS